MMSAVEELKGKLAELEARLEAIGAEALIWKAKRGIPDRDQGFRIQRRASSAAQEEGPVNSWSPCRRHAQRP